MGDKSPSAGASGVEGRKKEAPIQTAPNVTVTRDSLRDAGQNPVDKEIAIFGRQLQYEEYALLVGAQEGSKITAYVDYNGDLAVDVTGPNIEGQRRVFTKDSAGNPYIYNSYFRASNDAPKGFGTKVFTDQVNGARAMGIKTIKTTAAGSRRDSNYNGYYTWPRMGYDGPIPSDLVSRIPAPIKWKMGRDTIQELYRTPEGRKWWKQNGRQLNLTFDTDPNSLSSSVLEAYNEERSKRKK